MSKADDSHHDAAAGHDDHGAHDDHAHEVAEDFIPENSAFDMLLRVVVSLAGLGLITMMFIWYSAPTESPEHGVSVEHAAPAAAEPGSPSAAAPGAAPQSTNTTAP
jgi:hypothetical protein